MAPDPAWERTSSYSLKSSCSESASDVTRARDSAAQRRDRQCVNLYLWYVAHVLPTLFRQMRMLRVHATLADNLEHAPRPSQPHTTFVAKEIGPYSTIRQLSTLGPQQQQLVQSHVARLAPCCALGTPSRSELECVLVLEQGLREGWEPSRYGCGRNQGPA